MTSAVVAMNKTNNIVMPRHYIELDKDEMSYVYGGISTSAVAAAIDIGLCVICGVINASMKAAGWFGRGALKNTLRRNVPKWGKALYKAISKLGAFSGALAFLNLACNMFVDVDSWFDRLATLFSVGGIIASIMDICDGAWDGQISF